LAALESLEIAVVLIGALRVTLLDLLGARVDVWLGIRAAAKGDDAGQRKQKKGALLLHAIFPKRLSH
jgi:hypothetical protein